MPAPRRFALLLLVACAAVAPAACLSPTLPLPPPELPESVHESLPGQWVIAGSCTPGAIVSVFDEKTGKGVMVEDRAQSGSYAVLLEAKTCDTAWVQEQVGAETSPPTTFVVQEHAPGDPTGGTCTK